MEECIKKRRVWTHTLKLGSIENVHVDTCAICRKKLTEYCIDCVANLKIKTETEALIMLKDSSKNIWAILLLLQLRGILPFDALILEKIYNCCLPITQIKGCEVCKIGCDHIYHKHCFQKWLRKRENCPLCNTYYPR